MQPAGACSDVDPILTRMMKIACTIRVFGYIILLYTFILILLIYNGIRVATLNKITFITLFLITFIFFKKLTSC